MNHEWCGVYECRRTAGHRGCHTQSPTLLTHAWDLDYEAVVVRLVVAGLRAGRIDHDPAHARRWLARAAVL